MEIVAKHRSFSETRNLTKTQSLAKILNFRIIKISLKFLLQC